MASILVTDDEAGIREFLSDALELDGHQVQCASSGEQAIALLGTQSFALVLTDFQMPGVNGLELLRWIRSKQPSVPVIMLTAHGTVETAVAAMKQGAYDFLQKPISGPTELQALVRRALEKPKHAQGKALPTREKGLLAPVLSYGDPVMQPVVKAIEKVARTDATVLLLGESGAGKEVAARNIHQASARHDKNFVAINCAALTETLLESELFGHEKGAFTGADARRVGRIEAAEGGTFFLDEIGELKSELQAKLLRVLQERKYERVGGSETLEANVRWVAATNQDLRAMIAEGRFREDLYHRLAVFPIRLPALRERPRDILPLAESLLRRAASNVGREPMHMSKQAQDKLMAHTWPGNVRELANVLERACILADTDELSADDLWLEEASTSSSLSAGPDQHSVQHLLAVERNAIARALASVQGNRRKAAELLGIGERTLYDKIKKYEL